MVLCQIRNLSYSDHVIPCLVFKNSYFDMYFCSHCSCVCLVSIAILVCLHRYHSNSAIITHTCSWFKPSVSYVSACFRLLHLDLTLSHHRNIVLMLLNKDKSYLLFIILIITALNAITKLWRRQKSYILNDS